MPTDALARVDALVASLIDLDPAQIDALCRSLPPEELLLVERALARPEVVAMVGRDPTADWRATPATLAHRLTQGRIKLWRYSLLLGEKFRQAVTGESTRQLWTMPPRYGKSLWASRWGPAWALDGDPALPLILVSYGSGLAVENCMAVRNILRDHRQVLRAQLSADRQTQGRFITTEGGGVLGASIASAIAGFPAGGVIFDDPYKNWQEAHSHAHRELVDNTYRAVVTTRLESEHAFVIVCQTRWHEDDQTGRLTQRMEDGSGEAWDLVRIPDIAEEYDPDSDDPFRRVPDLLGRQAGEVIEPERFSLAAVKARHLTAGSYLTAGIYQQRPAPEEGGEIKRAWWRLDEGLPPRYDDAVSSWDMKLKEHETGDFVVGQAWGRTGKDCWLVDQLRGQWNQAETESAIALLAVRNPWLRRHIIENTGNGPEVMVALRAARPGYQVSDEIAGRLGMTRVEQQQVSVVRQRGMPGLIANNPKGRKEVRMRAVSGYIEAGDVHLWARATWLGTFLDELSAFNNGAHDDQVDATSQALSRLLRGAAVVSAPKGDLPRTPVGRDDDGGQVEVIRPSRSRTARMIMPRTIPSR